MSEILAFLLGGACVAAWSWSRRARPTAPEPAPTDAPEVTDAAAPVQPASATPTPIEVDAAPKSWSSVAGALSEELAHLASGIEGHAQLLCEAMGDPPRVAHRVERLYSSVRRLRLLSEKVCATADTHGFAHGSVDIAALLAGVAHELDAHSVRSMHIRVEVPPALPPADANADALRTCALLCVQALVEREPGSEVLALRAAADGDEVRLVIEVHSQQHGAQPPSRLCAFTEGAARSLIQRLGGRMELNHVVGLRCRCAMWLPAAAAAPATATGEPAPVEASPHPFGGVMVVQADANLRDLLRSELNETRRRVVCCPDHASATSLFEATPERFELLVVDAAHAARDAARLAARACALSPDVRVLVIGGHGDADSLAGLAQHRHLVLRAPFSVMELREAYGALIGVADVSESTA